MKNTISVFCAMLILLLAFSNALAFTDSHKKAADDLLDTMNIDELLAASIEAMLQLRLESNPSIRPYEGTIREFFNKYMSGESLRDDFIQMYAETFSEEELIEVNAFYKTKTGQKALKTAPGLMTKGAALGQKRIQENLPELQSMIEQEALRIQELQNQQ